MDVGLAGFLTAVDAALRGRFFASCQLHVTPGADGKDLVRTLSRRERQVLQMVAEGLSSKEIAPETGLSVKTVARHRENLRQKLGRSGVAHLTRLAVRLSLLEP